MSRTVRVLLLIAAILVAAVVGYGIAQRMARPAGTSAPQLQVTAQPAPAEAPPPPVVAAARPPEAPKPKAAAVVDQTIDAQVAEDAAAVGMTTLDPDPEPPADQTTAPSQDASPPY